MSFKRPESFSEAFTGLTLYLADQIQGLVLCRTRGQGREYVYEVAEDGGFILMDKKEGNRCR